MQVMFLKFESKAVEREWVMRKVTVAIFIVLGLIALAGCRTGERQVLPRGVWQSEYPRIILYIDDFYRHFASRAYLRFVEVDGEMVKVVTSRRVRIDTELILRRISSLGDDGRVLQGENLFWGDWVFVDDQIHYEIHHNGQRITAIFNRITDYEPIDPKYWFPQHKHIFGVWESVYPEIVMYIGNADGMPRPNYFNGTFVLGGESVEAAISIHFNSPFYFLAINDASSFEALQRLNLERNVLASSSVLLSGRFELRMGNIIFETSSRDEFSRFPSEIVFVRMEDCEPINSLSCSEE